MKKKSWKNIFKSPPSAINDNEKNNQNTIIIENNQKENILNYQRNILKLKLFKIVYSIKSKVKCSMKNRNAKKYHN